MKPHKKVAIDDVFDAAICTLKLLMSTVPHLTTSFKRLQITQFTKERLESQNLL